MENRVDSTGSTGSADSTKEIKANEKSKKLGITTLVRTEARVRSGCGKSFTNDCGINYRNG